MVDIVERLQDIGAMSSDQEAARCAYDAMIEIATLRTRCEKAEARLDTSVTVGGGLSVHGTVEAIMRVQDYILLDSTHPVEKEDVRRSLARNLQASEAQCADLAKALEPFEVIATAILAEAPSDATFFILFQDCEGTAHRITFDQLRAVSSVLAAYRKGSQ